MHRDVRLRPSPLPHINVMLDIRILDLIPIYPTTGEIMNVLAINLFWAKWGSHSGTTELGWLPLNFKNVTLDYQSTIAQLPQSSLFLIRLQPGSKCTRPCNSPSCLPGSTLIENYCTIPILLLPLCPPPPSLSLIWHLIRYWRYQLQFS